MGANDLHYHITTSKDNDNTMPNSTNSLNHVKSEAHNERNYDASSTISHIIVSLPIVKSSVIIDDSYYSTLQPSNSRLPQKGNGIIYNHKHDTNTNMNTKKSHIVEVSPPENIFYTNTNNVPTIDGKCSSSLTYPKPAHVIEQRLKSETVLLSLIMKDMIMTNESFNIYKTIIFEQFKQTNYKMDKTIVLQDITPYVHYKPKKNTYDTT